MSGIIDVGRPVTIIGQFRDEVKIRDEDGHVSYIPKGSVEPQE
jgi:SH3-like domain-containing protein